MDVFLLPKKKLTSFPIMILGFLRVIVLMRIEGRYPILMRGGGAGICRIVSCKSGKIDIRDEK